MKKLYTGALLAILTIPCASHANPYPSPCPELALTYANAPHTLTIAMYDELRLCITDSMESFIHGQQYQKDEAALIRNNSQTKAQPKPLLDES